MSIEFKTALLHAVLVGAGGSVGALFRYGLSGLVHRLWSGSTFPLGTVIVNLLGCLVIGFLTGLAESRQLFAPEFRIFVLIGLLGGFTTFSTFGYETVAMLQDAEYLKAGLNVGIQVLAGLALVWVGHLIATRSF